ncbi:hypothetical protein GW17_00012228 [Ensete ventricosum]|nr:hypothetical protein GW17_00012228 [Ensete ventricosum]
MFKECLHPDEKQRMKLSQELGLKPRQVKLLAQQDRADNVVLRAENESLKNDNFRLHAAIRNVVCPSCGGPAILNEMSFDEQQLRMENARLKDELERLSYIASRYSGRQLQPLGPAPPVLIPSLDLDVGIYSRHFNEPPVVSCTDLIPIPQISDEPSPFPGMLIMDQDMPLVVDLAMTAADHLVRMCNTTEPLWVRRGGTTTVEVLDLEEHARMCPWPMDLKQQQGMFRTETSRDSAMVIMNSITMVDAFLDAVSHQQMHAELQFLSPLVPAREAHFFRYCQQNSEGTWIMVDFPVDGFQEGIQIPFPWYRRKTSGCVIQDMPNGYSSYLFSGGEKEHDEAVTENDNNVLHQRLCLRNALLTDEQRRTQIFLRACVIPLAQAASNSSHSVDLLLQESSTHPSGGSIVVYAPIDVDAVQVAMSSEDPSYIPLLPTGFVISPAARQSTAGTSSGGDGHATVGCLLTVGMQVLATAVPSAKLNLSSVTAIDNHLCNTIQQVRAVLAGGTATAEPAAVAPDQ